MGTAASHSLQLRGGNQDKPKLAVSEAENIYTVTLTGTTMTGFQLVDADTGAEKQFDGQMKADMHYKRFRHFGMDKVYMDLGLFGMGFNLKKHVTANG